MRKRMRREKTGKKWLRAVLAAAVLAGTLAPAFAGAAEEARDTQANARAGWETDAEGVPLGAGIWIKNTETEEKYYTYCVDPKLAYPKTGLAYDPQPIAEGSDLAKLAPKLERALTCLYPVNSLGLLNSGSPNPGFYTQEVIWTIILNDTSPEIAEIDYKGWLLRMNLSEEEAQMVIGYIENGVEPEITKPHIDDIVLTRQEDGSYAGSTVFLCSHEPMHQPQFTADPEGLTLTLEEEEGVGYRILATSTQAFADTYRDAAYVAGYSVADYQTVSGLSLFAPAPENPSTAGKAYQRMMGYQVTPFADSFQITVEERVPDASTGALTVGKTVASADGTAAPAGAVFQFKVALEDKTVNGVFGEMVFTDGVAQFELKDGESKTSENLPDGIGYVVRERPEADYKTAASGAEGVVAGGATAYAQFTNTYTVSGSPPSAESPSPSSPPPAESPSPSSPPPAESPSPSSPPSAESPSPSDPPSAESPSPSSPPPAESPKPSDPSTAESPEPDAPHTSERPERPDIPVYRPGETLPDPNIPEAPDEIIVIGDDEVPLSYLRVPDPDSTVEESYIYVVEDETAPLGGAVLDDVPKTGAAFTTGWLAAVCAAALVVMLLSAGQLYRTRYRGKHLRKR